MKLCGILGVECINGVCAVYCVCTSCGVGLYVGCFMFLNFCFYQTPFQNAKPKGGVLLETIKQFGMVYMILHVNCVS